MLDILLFEMVFLLSALITLWQVLFTTENMTEIHLVFAVGLMVALLAGHFGRKKPKYLWLILGLAGVIPFVSQPALRWSVVLLGLILWRYLVDIPRPTNELDYSDKILVIFFLLTGLVILRDNTAYFVEETAGLPIYLPLMYLSGVFFLRSLRHQRTGQSQGRVRRSNIFYMALIAITYLISQSQWLREQLRVGLFWLYQIFMRPINYVLEVITQWWFADPEGMMVPEEVAETMEPGPSAMEEFAEGVRQWREESAAGHILGNVILVLFLILVAYIIYRVYLRKMSFSRPVEQGDDIREQMSSVEAPKRKRRRERRPEGAQDQVRYYYRRFLDKVADQREVSDTSTDLDQKAKQLGLESHPMSQIYREVRYGDHPADQALVEEMKRLWQSLGRSD